MNIQPREKLQKRNDLQVFVFLPHRGSPGTMIFYLFLFFLVFNETYFQIVPKHQKIAIGKKYLHSCVYVSNSIVCKRRTAFFVSRV